MGLTGLRSGSEKKKESKHSKRKIEKKVSFYSKVRDAVLSLGAKKSLGKKKKLRSRHKKLKAYDLSALSEFLPDLETLTKKPVEQDLKINCKSRQTLLQKEAARMQAVLNDPSFIKDPFEAIHMHLLKNQPPHEEAKNKVSSSKGKKKDKKKRKKEKSTQEMEI